MNRSRPSVGALAILLVSGCSTDTTQESTGLQGSSGSGGTQGPGAAGGGAGNVSGGTAGSVSAGAGGSAVAGTGGSVSGGAGGNAVAGAGGSVSGGAGGNAVAGTGGSAVGGAGGIGTLLYSDDFDEGTGQWIIEQVSGGEVGVSDGLLDIKDNGGTTVWFDKPLGDSIAIEYQVRVLSTGASLRDMNCFWMALDPRSTPPMAADAAFFEVQRGGVFSQYHELQTYYAGFGANSNTTFRFRRYYPADSVPVEMQDLPRDEGRVILQDHDSDGTFRTGDVFLVSGRWYNVQLIYFKGKVEYHLDGEMAFEYQEQGFDVPYDSGFFGLRTTGEAHMQADSLRIYRLTR